MPLQQLMVSIGNDLPVFGNGECVDRPSDQTGSIDSGQPFHDAHDSHVGTGQRNAVLPMAEKGFEHPGVAAEHFFQQHVVLFEFRHSFGQLLNVLFGFGSIAVNSGVRIHNVGS